jgi:KH domain
MRKHSLCESANRREDRAVRYIIGRQGSIIKDIRSTFTKAEVHIPELLDETPDSVQTVRVTGPRENALECANFIVEAVHTKAFAQEHPRLRRRVSSDPKSTLLRLRQEQQEQQQEREQQEEQQERQQREPVEPKDITTSIGDGRARHEPAHTAESQQQQQQQQQQQCAGPPVQVPVTVRQELIKHIIGKAGINVQRLMQTYSIKLICPRADEGTASEQLVIEGSTQESAAACAAGITAMAERYAQQLQRTTTDDTTTAAAAAPGTAAGESHALTLRPWPSRLLAPVQRSRGGLVRALVSVPADAMGYIVGTHKCTLRSLQSTYCVQIVKPAATAIAAADDDDADGASQVLYVQGRDADSVQACVTRISAMLIERQSSEGHSPSVCTASSEESPVLTPALTQMLLQQPATAQQQQQQQQEGEQHASTAAVQQQQQQKQALLSAVAAPNGTRVCIAVHVPRALVYRITNRAVTLHNHHSVNVLRPNASAAAAAAGAVEVLGIAAPTVQQAEAGIAAIEATLAEYLQGGTLHRGGAPCVYTQRESGASLMLASLQQQQQQLQLLHTDGTVFTAASSDVSSLSDFVTSEQSGSDSAVQQQQEQQQQQVQQCSDNVAIETTTDSDCADNTLRPILGFNEIMRQYRAAHGLTRQQFSKHVSRQQ